MPARPVKIDSVLYTITFTISARFVKFTKYCLTRWNFKASEDIHWEIQYLVNVVFIWNKWPAKSEMKAKLKSNCTSDLWIYHYCDAIMGIVASQITSLTIVYTTVYSDADQSKHQSCASLAFVWGIHRGPVNSPHKGPVTRKMFPFDDVIMILKFWHYIMSVKLCH